MATQRRKRSTAGTGSRRKPSSSAPSKRSRRSAPAIDVGQRDEIKVLLMITAGALLFLADLNFLGEFGKLLKGIQFGLFGVGAYIFPLAIIAAVLAGYFIESDGSFLRRIIFGSLLFIDICTVSHLIVVKEQLASGDNAFMYCKSEFSGGGIVGGFIAGLLYESMGSVGAWLIAVLIAIILIMLITGASFFEMLEAIGMLIDRSVRAGIERGRERNERLSEKRERAEAERERRRQEDLEYEERRRVRREQSEKRREEKKLAGVPMDLTVGEPEAPKTDDGGIIPDADEIRYLDEEAGAFESSHPVPDRAASLAGAGADGSEIVFDDEEEDVPLDEEVPAEEATASDTATGSDEGDAGAFADTKNAGLSGSTGIELDDVCSVEFDYDLYDLDRLRSLVKPGVSSGRRATAAAEETASGVSSAADIPVASDAPVVSSGASSVPSQTVAVSDSPKPEYDPEPVYDTAPQAAPDISTVSAPAASSATHASSSTDTRPEARRKDTHSFISDGRKYRLPKPEDGLLKKYEKAQQTDDKDELEATKEALRDALDSFGIKVEMKGASRGPTVTRYEMLPERGTKVSRILNLSDDLKMALAATDIRIEAPIPGKSMVGIEVPNQKTTVVSMYELLASEQFENFKGGLAFAVGKGLSGETVVSDISKMPHVLIAGTTGSGKSVCVNTMIMSLLHKYTPDDLKLIMIDPKIVELSVYNGIPQLLVPVVTDPKQAAGALHWGVVEMDNRYDKFAQLEVRDLAGYNKKLSESAPGTYTPEHVPLPKIVIIVDELADLMMTAGKEVEESICRLLQKARACGIHLVIATQRPSVDVITGLIKANMPSRIAFSVSSVVDSRTILDTGGAEKLLGKGDMLFYPQGHTRPERLQGAFVSDDEVMRVVEFWRDQSDGSEYSEDITKQMKSAASSGSSTQASAPDPDEKDEYFVEAARFIITSGKASIGSLQRKFKIGFNRAARIMDQLYDAGIVGEDEGTKPRKINMSIEQLENAFEAGEL